MKLRPSDAVLVRLARTVISEKTTIRVIATRHNYKPHTLKGWFCDGRKRGLPIPDIAAWRRATKAPLTRPRRPGIAARNRRWAKRLAAGDSATVIAREYGVTPGTVWATVSQSRRRGAKLPYAGGVRQRWSTPANLAKADRLHATGISWVGVAKSMGVPTSWVMPSGRVLGPRHRRA